MKQAQKLTTIIWLKRIVGLITFIVWVYLITLFLKDPAPFKELALYCMGSTMLIFGISTGVFKALEYWENKIFLNNEGDI